MLSNAYFLAKFRFDTAENEPAKNLQNFRKYTTDSPLWIPAFRSSARVGGRFHRRPESDAANGVGGLSSLPHVDGRPAVSKTPLRG